MRTMPLEEATEKYGKEIDGDVSILDADFPFVWDYKVCMLANSNTQSGDFLKKLDDMLAVHGLEVVTVDFDGDTDIWLIDKKGRHEGENLSDTGG